MTTTSVFSLHEFLHTVDGVVVGPAWTDDRCRGLLRALRLAQPAAPGPRSEDEPATENDLASAAKIYHQVLSLSSRASRWPIFAGASSRPSLFKEAVRAASEFDDAALYALCQLSDGDHLLASNIARWLLQMEQQRNLTMVFAVPPPALHRPSSRVRSSRAIAREIAAVA